MRQSGRCPKCGSSEVIRSAQVMSWSEGSHKAVDLRVDADPTALVFKKASYTPLQACVCGSCGFTELYAANQAALMEAWRLSQ